jgi:signal transduction histidine kinase
MSDRTVRRSYFVDKKVQGALVNRVARYWLLSVVVVATLTVLGWIFVTPGMGALVQLRAHLPMLLGGMAVALLASMIVLPVILYDVVRVSNRFAGPMLRLRRGMGQVAAGVQIEPIHFRGEDYWQDFADVFNELNNRLQSQEKELQQLRSEPSAELTAAI